MAAQILQETAFGKNYASDKVTGLLISVSCSVDFYQFCQAAGYLVHEDFEKGMKLTFFFFHLRIDLNNV